MNLREEINKLKKEGYSQQNAQARICQDIILEAISKCHLNENVTIKGGVVMRNISNDVRRATVDLDFDFIKKSISDDSIKLFVNQLNTVSDVTITIIGKIEELKLCIERYIFEDKTLKVNNKADIVSRIERIFSNKIFIKNIKTSKKNWLDLSLEEVFQKDLKFVKNLKI